MYDLSSIQSEINSLEDLATIATHLPDIIGTEIYWRGHGDFGNYKLVPSAFRRNDGATYECNVARRFMLRAGMYNEKVPDRSDFPSWLCLMQHYRLPTRLLDWSESPLVAIYFAVNELENTDGALWALSPSKLNFISTGMEKLFTSDSHHLRHMFAKPFSDTCPNTQKTCALLPRQVDLRMTLQTSTFTIHEDHTPLELNHRKDEFLFKFKINKNSKYHLRKQLIRLGVRKTTLFPDLEALAWEVKNFW